jgi:hypothetical protein
MRAPFKVLSLAYTGPRLASTERVRDTAVCQICEAASGLNIKLEILLTIAS